LPGTSSQLANVKKLLLVPGHNNVQHMTLMYFATMMAHYSILGLSYGGDYALLMFTQTATSHF